MFKQDPFITLVRKEGDKGRLRETKGYRKITMRQIDLFTQLSAGKSAERAACFLISFDSLVTLP